MLAVFELYIHYWLLVPKRNHRDPLLSVLTSLNNKGGVGLDVACRLTHQPRLADPHWLVKLALNKLSKLTGIKMKSPSSAFFKHLSVKKVGIVCYFTDHITNLLILYCAFEARKWCLRKFTIKKLK